MRSCIFQIEFDDFSEEDILSVDQISKMAMKEGFDYIGEESDYVDDVEWVSTYYGLTVYDNTGRQIKRADDKLILVDDPNYPFYIDKKEFYDAIKKRYVDTVDRLKEFLCNNYSETKNLIDVQLRVKKVLQRHGFYFVNK